MKKTILLLLTFALVVTVAGCGFWLAHYFIDSREQRQTSRNTGGRIYAGRSASAKCSGREQFFLGFL